MPDADYSGRHVVLVDDVVSTGSTVCALRLLMERAEANITAEISVFTEGDDDAENQLPQGVAATLGFVFSTLANVLYDAAANLRRQT